jgi:methylated-DNA-protein-cysteine methyltransferase-like protein
MSSGGTDRSLYARIYAQVRRIPRGKVATYGQIAELAGLPNHARLVGYALHALGDEGVPWQRVINARGQVSPRSVPDWAGLQRRLLEGEGVRFDDRGRIDLRRFGWKVPARRVARRRRGLESRARSDEDPIR